MLSEQVFQHLGCQLPPCGMCRMANILGNWSFRWWHLGACELSLLASSDGVSADHIGRCRATPEQNRIKARLTGLKLPAYQSPAAPFPPAAADAPGQGC